MVRSSLFVSGLFHIALLVSTKSKKDFRSLDTSCKMVCISYSCDHRRPFSMVKNRSEADTLPIGYEPKTLRAVF